MLKRLKKNQTINLYKLGPAPSVRRGNFNRNLDITNIKNISNTTILLSNDSNKSDTTDSSSPLIPDFIFEEKPALRAQDAHYDKLENQKLAIDNFKQEHENALKKIINDDTLVGSEKLIHLEEAGKKSDEFFAAMDEDLNEESESLEIPSPDSEDLRWNNDSILDYEVEQRTVFEREYTRQLIQAKEEIELENLKTKELLSNQDTDISSSNKRELDEATSEQEGAKRFKQDSSDVTSTEYDSSDYYED